MGKTLYEHAQYELKKLGLHTDDDEDSRPILVNTLALVKHFSKMEEELTERQHKWVVEFFTNLANHGPLSPITDDPAEWEEFIDKHTSVETKEETETHRWQSKRQPSLISTDGGKTYTDLKTNTEGTSIDHIKQAEDWKKQREARIEAKKAAEAANNNAESAKNMTAQPPLAPPTDTSTPPGEDAPAASPVPEGATAGPEYSFKVDDKNIVQSIDGDVDEAKKNGIEVGKVDPRAPKKAEPKKDTK